jgi:hypothetical protein
MLPLNLSSLHSLLAQSRKLLLGPFRSQTRLCLSRPKADRHRDKFVLGHLLLMEEPRLSLALCLAKRKKGSKPKSVRQELRSATMSYLERHEGALQGGKRGAHGTRHTPHPLIKGTPLLPVRNVIKDEESGPQGVRVDPLNPGLCCASPR